MAVTKDVPLTGDWQAIATAGEVAFTPTGTVYWAVTGDANPPGFTGGHIARAFMDTGLTLTGTERLWVKSSGDSGSVFVTADAPVT